MREYLFDDKDSIIHAILGLITPITLPFGFFIFMVFMIYEIQEPENPVSTLGDVLEYFTGLLFMLLFQLYVFIHTQKVLLLIKT